MCPWRIIISSSPLIKTGGGGRETAPGTALTTLEEAPTDPRGAGGLAVLLTELARTDDEAAAWLTPWFEQARVATVTTTGPVTNIISGQAQVHTVIQGQTFNGPIYL